MTKTLTLHLALLLCLLGNAYAQTKADILSSTAITLGESNDTVRFVPNKLVSVDTTGAEVKTYIEPAIQLSKWNNEETLILEIPSDVGYTDKTVDNTTGEVKMSNKSEGFYFKKYDAETLKFGIILYSIPKSNKWVFNIIGAENLEFVRPASIFKDGVAQHIEEQLGGYKINSKVTGEKFGFFKQPIFRDAKGNTCKARLLIEKDQYIITVPQEFLDKAVYPVIANDSFDSFYDGYIRALTVSVAQNDLIVVGYSYNDINNTATISDENANSYSQVGTGVNNFGTGETGCGIQVWYAIANTTNSACTITCSFKSDPGLSCHIYSGMDTSDPYDNHLTYVESTGTATHATGNLAVSTSAGKLFSYWANELGATALSATTGQGWTERTEEAGHTHQTQDKAFTASGNYTATMTSNPSAKYICIFVAFNAASDGGATPRRRIILISKNDIHKTDTDSTRRLGDCLASRKKVSA